ncbi:MAG: BcpO-related WXXGXW repeat protein [Chlorobiaceae bacterium]|nr:BcpO-related WXXGXW repeat protein [Chlorobiaceae bacterium]
MKKSIFFAAGVAGMLLGTAAVDAHAADNGKLYARNERITIGIESRPNFIMLPKQGFSVAIESPYDIVFYDNRYYINRDGSWYQSKNYRGPWEFIREKHLPSKVRKYRLEEIRQFRDNEYNRSAHGNRIEQQRNDENSRRTLEQQRSDENSRRTLEQQRSDENSRRTLEQQRSDENNRRTLEQQRSDENNRRILEQQRSDETNKR